MAVRQQKSERKPIATHCARFAFEPASALSDAAKSARTAALAAALAATRPTETAGGYAPAASSSGGASEADMDGAEADWRCCWRSAIICARVCSCKCSAEGSSFGSLRVAAGRQPGGEGQGAAQQGSER
jgi:hypothetical protein